MANIITQLRLSFKIHTCENRVISVILGFLPLFRTPNQHFRLLKEINGYNYNGLFLRRIHFGDLAPETRDNIVQLVVLQTTFPAQG